MKYAKLLIKWSAAIGVTFPWFFKNQLGELIYWMAGVSFALLLLLDVFPPRPQYWRLSLFMHLIFIFGCALVVLPIIFSMGRLSTLFLAGVGSFIVVFFGYAARMESIGRPDPALQLLLEIRGKLRAKIRKQ